MTVPAAPSPETALPRFTLFGLAEKTAPAHGGNLDQAPRFGAQTARYRPARQHRSLSRHRHHDERESTG